MGKQVKGVLEIRVRRYCSGWIWEMFASNKRCLGGSFKVFTRKVDARRAARRVAYSDMVVVHRG